MKITPGTISGKHIFTVKGWKFIPWYNLQSTEMKNYLLGKCNKPQKKKPLQWIGSRMRIVI